MTFAWSRELAAKYRHVEEATGALTSVAWVGGTQWGVANLDTIGGMASVVHEPTADEARAAAGCALRGAGSHSWSAKGTWVT